TRETVPLPCWVGFPHPAVPRSPGIAATPGLSPLGFDVDPVVDGKIRLLVWAEELESLVTELLRDGRFDSIPQRHFVGRSLFADVGWISKREGFVTRKIRGGIILGLHVECRARGQDQRDEQQQRHPRHGFLRAARK